MSVASVLKASLNQMYSCHPFHKLTAKAVPNSSTPASPWWPSHVHQADSCHTGPAFMWAVTSHLPLEDVHQLLVLLDKPYRIPLKGRFTIFQVCGKAIVRFSWSYQSSCSYCSLLDPRIHCAIIFLSLSEANMRLSNRGRFVLKKTVTLENNLSNFSTSAIRVRQLTPHHPKNIYMPKCDW